MLAIAPVSRCFCAGRIACAAAATPPPLLAPHAAVASDHPAASAAGVQVLRAGGNAADAACATALALGVVNPHASGIGGGGFALVYLAREGACTPWISANRRRCHPAGHVSRTGKPVPERRPGAAAWRWACPARCAGWPSWSSASASGRSPTAFARPSSWRPRALPPSPRLALVAGRRTAASAAPRTSPTSRRCWRARFVQDAAAPGGSVTRPALARTLRQLRERGPEPSTRGPSPRRSSKAVKDAGGVMLPEDLRRYSVIERTPMEIDYRGFRVLSMPPPSSGGIVMAEALGILAAAAARASERPRRTAVERLPARAGRGAEARLRRSGPPAGRPRLRRRCRLAKLLDPRVPPDAGRAHRRQQGAGRRQVRHGAAGRAPRPGRRHRPPVGDRRRGQRGGADHDREPVVRGAPAGRATPASCSTTRWTTSPWRPSTPNAFGLVGNAQNAVAPGKRPLSSMSPTSCWRGRGEDGGRRRGRPDHHQRHAAGAAERRSTASWTPRRPAPPRASTTSGARPAWRYEADIPRDVVEALQRRGHKTKPRDHTLALVNVIVRTRRPAWRRRPSSAAAARPAGY